MAHELAVLQGLSPLYDAVIDEIDGRRIRIGDHWLTDWASCNYLGFDLDPEIIAAVEPALRRWGTHPSWSRLLGSPRPYPQIEERLTELLSAPDTLVLPTITHIHLTVLPAIVGRGRIFLDRRAHRTLFEGSRVAAGLGATVHQHPANDLEALQGLLAAAPADGHPRVICTDGVNSMTGNLPDLLALADLADRYDALLYVDDAHGFGVIGERAQGESCPYGLRGNGIVRHTGLDYDRIIMVGGFSKAYSSLLAFLALPTTLKQRLKVAAFPYLYSGPSPVASLATTLAGFDVNAARGEAIRADLHRKTARVLAVVEQLGLSCLNRSGLPILEIPVSDPDDLLDVGRYLFNHGVYATMAAHPLVPRNEVGFRIQVTAANTDQEIEELCQVLRGLDGWFRPAADPSGRGPD
ncbi:MAG: 8-amino-7-oxononanoate synthase [Actinomycetota bacterium]|nr:8-amino-7-oxononanoate synthase [Actinomycetota bacterium]